jgi:nucleotide-binding universal stress UspA family protein
MELAGLTGGAVDVVAAWSHPAGLEWTVRTTNYGLVPVPELAAREDVEAAAVRTVAGMVAEAEAGHAGVQVDQSAREGHPTAVLLDAAKGADLLVLGRTGHGGAVSALLGSVSHHCIQHAECPVVVVPQNPEAGAPAEAGVPDA